MKNITIGNILIDIKEKNQLLYYIVQYIDIKRDIIRVLILDNEMSGNAFTFGTYFVFNISQIKSDNCFIII